MKVLVTGSRNWSDVGSVYLWLDRCVVPGQPFTLYHGGCRTGADAIADSWARRRGFQVVVVPANWKKYGRAAGPLRNKAMVETYGPDVDWFLVFSRDRSSGTENTLQHIYNLSRKSSSNIVIMRSP